MRSNAEISRAFYDAYNRRDWDALADLLAPTVEWFHAARHELIRGVDAVLALFRSSAEAFPNARIEVSAVHESGSTVISEWSYIHANNSNGKKKGKRAIACDVEEIRNGRLVRGSTYGDTLQMLMELEQGAAALPAVPVAPVIRFAAR